MLVFHAVPLYVTVFVVTPLQLLGVALISGALYRHVVFASYGLSELYVPPLTQPLVGTVKSPHAEHAVVLLL